LNVLSDTRLVGLPGDGDDVSHIFFAKAGNFDAVTIAYHFVDLEVFHRRFSSLIDATTGFESKHFEYVRGLQTWRVKGAQFKSDVPFRFAIAAVAIRVARCRKQ